MTGGGSLLDGMTDRTEQMLGMSVRVGYPVNVLSHDHSAFHPSYSTSLGLLKYTQDVASPIVAKPLAMLGARRRDTGLRVRNWLLQKIG